MDGSNTGAMPFDWIQNTTFRQGTLLFGQSSVTARTIAFQRASLTAKLPRGLTFRRELEAILVIQSDDPRKTASKIAEITDIAHYRVVPEKPKTLHDVYLDTRDKRLNTSEMNLRIRGENENYWITLKTYPRPTFWGGQTRQEMELSWSPIALGKVLGEIGLPFKDLRREEVVVSTDPVTLLKGLGFEVVQDRETHRDIRNIRNIVSSKTDYPQVLAELDIDSVTYHFGEQEVYLYEVEVESKIKEGHSTVKNIIKALRDTYGTSLRSWRHRKLATGEAVEKMMKSGELVGLLDSRGRLSSGAYERLNRIL